VRIGKALFRHSRLSKYVKKIKNPGKRLLMNSSHTVRILQGEIETG